MVSRSGSRSSNGLLPPFHLGHAVSITFFNKKVSQLFSGPFYDPFPFPRTHEYPVSPIDEKPKVAFSRLSASSGPRGLLAIPCSSAARNAAKGRVEPLTTACGPPTFGFFPSFDREPIQQTQTHRTRDTRLSTHL